MPGLRISIQSMVDTYLLSKNDFVVFCLCQSLPSSRDLNRTENILEFSSVQGLWMPPDTTLLRRTMKERWGNKGLLSRPNYGGSSSHSRTLFSSHLERMHCNSPNSSMLLHQSMGPAYCSLFPECLSPLLYLIFAVPVPNTNSS